MPADDHESVMLRLRSGLLAQEGALKQLAGRQGATLTVQSVGPLVRLFKQLQGALPGQVESFDYHADPNSALPQIAHAIWVVEQSLGISSSKWRSWDNVAPRSMKRTQIDEDGTVFIGHGHSSLWRELKDFIADTLKLPWDEFG
jgi:hypothetical protein